MIEKALNRLRNADADLKEVLRGSAIAFGVKIVAAGSAFAMNVVIAGQLGAEEAGLFFLAYTIVFIAAAVSRLGLDNTFVRFIAARHATNEWGWIKGLYGSVGFLLSMTGHEKLLRNNVLIAAVTTLALGFTLVPPHGIMGAAIATACGVALQNLLGVWQVRRVLGFNTLAIWR